VGASPRTDTGGADDLTPQERQIAALAAEGRTNREIVALLFLSPPTIETLLGSVFRELGIRDHTALNTTDPSEA
jgi:DNA-binding CsgD family transcriptional regulator